MNQDLIDRIRVEANEEWNKWNSEIPAVQFCTEWEVKLLLPVAGALVRFWVMMNGKTVSVYLDGFDRLGCCGEPYWEIYAMDLDKDPERFSMHEWRKMMDRIGEMLEP
jgi:hypothetical protein